MRYTPHIPNIYNLGSISYLIDQIEPTKYVIAREQDPREHYHIAVWGVKRTSENLRAFLKQKTEGQWYISGKEITDQIKAIAYCFKEGEYTHKGLNVVEFLQAISVSKPKHKYDKILQGIEQDYDGDDKKFVRKLLEAHVLCNKKVYLPHIKAQLLLTKLKKEKYGTYKDYLVEKILDTL